MTAPYHIVNEIVSNNAFRNRLVGCVACEPGIEEDPRSWVDRRMLRIATRSDVMEAWSYAEDNKTVNVNPDTGARTDVINDQMILSIVQAIHAEDIADSPAE